MSMSVAPFFVPPHDQHIIDWMDLQPEHVPAEIQSLLPDIYTLAALADSLRALQAIDGRFLDEQVASALLKRSAALLKKIADALPGPTAQVLRMRADGLLANDHTEAALRQIDAPDHPLVLLCGPICSWRNKTKGTLHGVVASSPINRLNMLIQQADSLIESIERHFQTILAEPTLKVGSVPPFVVTQLFACGGEPNTFPKHFSYFLPEDEGVKYAPKKKTVVYANLYYHRFCGVSRQLAGEMLVPAEPVAFTPEQCMRDLLLWFRGHDIGHSFVLPETEYRRLRPLKMETSVMLQEAIADVMGFLMTVRAPWQNTFQTNAAESGSVFLAEMLRYIRRGLAWFPDSRAAFFELSHLLASGSVSLVEDGTKIFWEPDRFYAGMVELAKDLVNIVLRADLSLAERLLADHTMRADHALEPLLTRLRTEIRHIPTAYAYHVAI